MKHYLCIFIFTLLFLEVNAQLPPGDLAEKYDSGTIFQYGSSRYMLNGKLLKRKAIRDLLLSCPESAEEYRRFQKRKKIGNAMIVLACGMYVSSFFVIAENFDLARALLGGTLGTTIGAGQVFSRATRHLQRSVWLYNRCVITGTKGSGKNAPG